MQWRYLVDRLSWLEPGDAIIHRSPGWILAEALKELGPCMGFHLDEETSVLTCTHRSLQ